MSASFSKILDNLVALSIIGGLGVYFVLDARETERARIQQSIEFAKLLQSNEARAASFDLFEPWRNYDLTTLNAVGAGRAVLDKFVRDVVTGTEGLEKKVYETTAFYDTLALCVETGACHAETAEGLLGQGAHDFYCLYRSIIVEMRSGGRDLGVGLERFATQEKSCAEAAQSAAADPS